MFVRSGKRPRSWPWLELTLAGTAFMLRCVEFAPDGPISATGGFTSTSGGAASSAGGACSPANCAGAGERFTTGGANFDPNAGAGGDVPAGGAAGGVAGEATAGISAGMAGSVHEDGGAEGEPMAPFELLAERSVLESNPDALLHLELERVLARLEPLSDVDTSYRRLIYSFGPRAADAAEAGPYCDDETPAQGDPPASTLNGFALPCPAEAASLEYQLPAWRPLAAVNRFDLAPSDGANCGEQHLNFYYDTRFSGQPDFPVRAYLRFAAVITNPHPELGLEGCRPLANFWASLSSPGYDAPESRARALEYTFLGSVLTPDAEPAAPEIEALIAAGFQPLISPQHFAQRGRLEWLYQGNYGIWHFFAHALVPAEQGGILREALDSLPIDALVNDHPKRELCSDDFLSRLSSLLASDISQLTFAPDADCRAATSSTADGSLVTGLTDGEFGPDIATRIDNYLRTYFPDSHLTARQVAARADFAGTCNGCHMPDNPLLVNPDSVAHISEDRLVACGSARGEQTRRCHARSPVVETLFLPRWLQRLNEFWRG